MESFAASQDGPSTETLTEAVACLIMPMIERTKKANTNLGKQGTLLDYDPCMGHVKALNWIDGAALAVALIVLTLGLECVRVL